MRKPRCLLTERIVNCLVLGGILLMGTLLSSPAYSYTITVFPPGTYDANTAAMDARLRVTSLTVEDFETTPSLTAPSGVTFNRSAVLDPDVNTIWDGSAHWAWQGTGATEVVMTLPEGANRVGIGLGGVVADMNFNVNSEAPVLLGSLGLVTDNLGRNGYVLIEAEPGDAPITSLRFLATQGNDYVRFDHLAFGRLTCLADDFEDGSIDTSKWATDVTGTCGTPSVVEQNGRMEFTNRGILRTVDDFDPAVSPLTITGIWTFGPGDDRPTVHTRTPGMSTAFFCDPQGISFFIREFGGNMYIARRDGGESILATMSIDVNPNDQFAFAITDDGLNLTFDVQEIGGDGTSGSLQASSSYTAGSKVSFSNIQSTGITSFLEEVEICTEFVEVVPLQINEFRVNDENPGDQGNQEQRFIEIRGEPGTSLDGIHYVIIGDRENNTPPCSQFDRSGVVEAVYNLNGRSIPADGYFLMTESNNGITGADWTLNLSGLEGGNRTHLMVRGWSGSYCDDLDDPDDGVLDSTPWTEIVDWISPRHKLTEDLVAPFTGLDAYYYSPNEFGCLTTENCPFGVPHFWKEEGGWESGRLLYGVNDTPGYQNATTSQTGTGTNVTVSGSGAQATFTSVTGEGTTTFVPLLSGESPPADFVLTGANPPIYWNIESDATFSGTIEVCLSYDPASVADESQLRVFHRPTAGPAGFRTITSGPANGQICIAASSLSPFLLVEPAPGATGSVPASLARHVLYDNVPNPFNPRTVIRFELASRTAVDLAIFDLAGRRVKTLVAAESYPAGTHSITWNGTDDSGREVASGVYLYQLEADGVTSSKRMALLR